MRRLIEIVIPFLLVISLLVLVVGVAYHHHDHDHFSGGTKGDCFWCLAATSIFIVLVGLIFVPQVFLFWEKVFPPFFIHLSQTFWNSQSSRAPPVH